MDMKPVACLLDGRFFETRERAHEILKGALGFPAYYGMNLDALYDCLTDLSNVTLRVYFAADARRALGDYADALFRVMTDAARNNGALSVLIYD